MRWKEHSEVHVEQNKCETIKQRGTGVWNICKRKNNKNNKTIREIWVQKGNPSREVRARVYCISVWSFISESRVSSWSSVFDVWGCM